MSQVTKPILLDETGKQIVEALLQQNAILGASFGGGGDGGGTVEEGSLAYELSADGTYYIVAGIGTIKGTKVVVPNYHEGKPVKHIKDNAFSSNPEITSFTVGRNVEYIGYNNLDIMTNLSELYFIWDFTREELAEQKIWPPEYIDPDYPPSGVSLAWALNGWINTIQVAWISDTELDVSVGNNINCAEDYKSGLADFLANMGGTEPSMSIYSNTY